MQKINFQNLPNTTTPINATNLNAIQTNTENAINDVAGDLSDYVDGTTSMGDIKATSIEISRGSGSQSRVRTIRTDTGADIEFGVGYAGINRGIYDNTSNKWILVTDGSTNTINGDTIINGNLTSSNIQDSGWIELSLASGFAQSGWNNLKYRKKNGIVTIMGAVQTTAQTSWTKVITNIPDGYRPSSEFDVVCRTSWNQVMKIAISANGDISTLNLNDGTDIPSGEYIFIAATYIV